MNRSIKNTLVIFTSLIFLLSCNLMIMDSSAEEVVLGREYESYIDPNTQVSLTFMDPISFFDKLDFLSDVEVNLSVSLSPLIYFRQISLIINNSIPISLHIDIFFNLLKFLSEIPENPTLDDFILLYDYNCYYRLISNVSIDLITIHFSKNLTFGLNPEKNYAIALYHYQQSSWEAINTIEVPDSQNSMVNLESSIQNLESNKPYFFTVYQKSPTSYNSNDRNFIVFVAILIFSILIALIIVISKQDYIKYLKTRVGLGQNGNHRLSLEEVLENQNRNKILELILENPGIHFNELLRKIDLSPGNLVWHLDILKSYKVIGKRRFEHYVIYYPYYQMNPISNIDLKLQKSELTLKVLEIIKKNPGIWNSQIAMELCINRKTIKYHIQKLIDHELITIKKSGRKNLLYARVDPKNGFNIL